MKAQREPVEIKKHDKRVGVMVFADMNDEWEEFKLAYLMKEIGKSDDDIAAGRTVDGAAAMKELMDELK